MYDKYEDTKILRPGLKLIGAKTKIRGLLYSKFPADYNQFVEPFMGTAGVLIGHSQVGSELAGDTDPYRVNYYRVLQTKPEDFWLKYQEEKDSLVLFGKPYFERMKYRITRTLDSIEQAVLFYLITKVCFNGIWRLNSNGECNSSYCGTTKGRGFFTRPWFDLVVSRIKEVRFHQADYRVLLSYANRREKINPYIKDPIPAKFTPENTFVFLDPPYVLKCNEVLDGCKTIYNGTKFPLESYKEMQSYLVKADYKWMLTINDCEFIREVFKDFKIQPLDVNYSCSQTPAGRGIHKELIITNYEL